jgi:MFS family permease
MIQMFLVALALVGLVDAISYMVVAPSIVFYVLENGGTKEQYGIILSAFSFASFAFKPLVGFLSDRFGFRVPYFATLGTAAFGGFIYFIADAFEGTTAVALILVGRLLGGIGASSAALGFAYLAKVVPHEEQTKTNSLLSMTRILGMASGPGFNILLAGIDTKVFQLEINSLNSVGLFIMLTNLISLGSIFLFLKEPDRDFSAPPTDHSLDTGFSACVRASMRFDILFPIYSIFAFNAAFQL